MREDVLAFERNLADNLLILQEGLADFSYRHGPYERFMVNDPKPRVIHKATVADRVVHRALYRHLYPFFDRVFIADSYSCRLGKGMHLAIEHFRRMAGQASHNHRKTIWVLKGDIRKFFASIDHDVLRSLLRERVVDERVHWLASQVIRSHDSGRPGVGLPLGNLTSQLFANVYLNELDQFVKHRLKGHFYVRYADDFVVMSEDRSYLEATRRQVEDFLWNRLRLQLHPDKVSIMTAASGVDFLGWVHFPDHRVLRAATRDRMMRNMMDGMSERSTASYLGMLSHGNARGLEEIIAGFPPSRE